MGGCNVSGTLWIQDLWLHGGSRSPIPKKKLRMLGAKVQRTKIGDSELRVGEWDVGLRYPTSSRFRNPTEFQEVGVRPMAVQRISRRP